ncbi:hypothetical protein FF36_05225 [Frankia torreyi]|uniref:Uncharacterized protein n=1 Tax=Frankia torreyi TaxID=1856 RepID=A0A0D8B866_9ACTN|nr:hypothetical protein FF36_05225 [Frankia torreyi]KQM02970.1 hypothetical protein FF86_105124 [Frankia sp. CpI1-P]
MPAAAHRFRVCPAGEPPAVVDPGGVRRLRRRTPVASVLR